MRAFVPVLAAAALLAGMAQAGGWPQAGGNPQHTGFTTDSPIPPYRKAWVADFSPEMIYSAQPVVMDGRVYVTTLNGSLYALALADGQRLWHYRAGEAIWGSAAAGMPETGGEGLVFVASWDGVLHALDAATGTPRWTYDAGEPISGSPCLADERIFLGTRKGHLLAVGMDGQLAWRRQLSWQLFNTVAWDGGRIYAVTMDVRVHCLNGRTGERLWRSEQLWGMVPREFYPVVHDGRVFITLTPSSWRFEHSFGPYAWNSRATTEIMEKYTRPLPGGKVEPPRTARISLLTDGTIPPELERVQRQIVQWYTKQPEYQSFYMLDGLTGKQDCPAVHLYESAGLQNTISPPAVCADGRLVVNIMLGGARCALFDPRRNRWTDYLFELWGANNDEWGCASVGGERVFSKNAFRNFMVDLTTRQTVDLGHVKGDGAKRVSVLPPAPEARFPFSPDRLGGSGWGIGGTYPPVIADRMVLWAIHSPNLLVAFEGSQP